MSNDKKCPNCENTWPEGYGPNCPRCGHSFAVPAGSAGPCPICGNPGCVGNECTSLDEGDAEEREWCDTCGNLGVIICRCGGDLCVCANRGEYPCPDCG